MPLINMRTQQFEAEHHVRIDRQTVWGNPYRGKDLGGGKDQAIILYKRHLWDLIQKRPDLLNELANMHDKHLACWCTPERCHGEVLEKAATWAHKMRATFERRRDKIIACKTCQRKGPICKHCRLNALCARHAKGIHPMVLCKCDPKKNGRNRAGFDANGDRS